MMCYKPVSLGFFCISNENKGWDLVQNIFLNFFFVGVERFSDDIKSMLGFRPGIFWRICWKFLSPAILLVCKLEFNYCENILMFSVFLCILCFSFTLVPFRHVADWSSADAVCGLCIPPMGDCRWMVDCNVIFKFHPGIFYLYTYHNTWYLSGSKMFFFILYYLQ